MKKYITSASIAFGEYFVYRLNFILWRVRNILSVLMMYFLWHAVYLTRIDMFTYTRESMLTYILLIIFVGSVVLSTRAYKIAEDITTGNLKTFLLQPINYLGVALSKEVTDKLINITFSLVEFAILFIVLHPPLVLPQSMGTLFLFAIALFLGASLYFEFGVILSCIGFWSREVWAPRFLFYIIVTFLSGMYFPLDIVEGPLGVVLTLLPFGYLIYFPIAVFLERLPPSMLLNGFFLSLLWLLVLSLVSHKMWQKGLRTFTAEGS